MLVYLFFHSSQDFVELYFSLCLALRKFKARKLCSCKMLQLTAGYVTYVYFSLANLKSSLINFRPMVLLAIHLCNNPLHVFFCCSFENAIEESKISQVLLTKHISTPRIGF
ncbi:hypothetical protein BRADI_4g44207v3 [Brachypodium distachyon]|uniref:Uncharacterized protein n=1 Tax=Brachypodium distachyon TaxID=15368 RepID=A0A0Q3EYR4_BRADI|nr:hypothetical protein BRADI_4g44207v3 [Brachypodium distachyon]